MDPYLNDWLDLLLRWLHVVAGIVWIGTSFYFVALDNHLAAPGREVDREEGVGGEAWEVHGGGFYRVQKFGVAPRRLPEHLIWFKWEAYTTWLSGFALFVTLYYVNAETYLIDPAVAALEPWEAVAISLGLLVAAWVVYDVLCRLLAGREGVLAAAILGLVVLSSWGLFELYSGRGATIQLGAMLGTIMVANVFFTIIPGHWQLVRARAAGREVDPIHGLRGKQRSVHNNYLTLPVVLAMVGNHFAFVYGRERGWLVLVALMAVGAYVRLFFNLRHAGRTHWAIPVTAALAVVAIAVTFRPDETVGAAREVALSEVAPVVRQRCAPCHSATPTLVSAAPAGITFDSAEGLRRRADAIERVVSTRAMPPGNVTHMTDAERDLLVAWARGRR